MTFWLSLCPWSGGNLNRGKRSIVINMADSRGVALARDLVRQSDVVVDNFSSRVMRNWGFLLGKLKFSERTGSKERR